MNQIIANLALIHLNQFCKSNLVNISGSHVEKDGRGFRYKLVYDTGGLIATVTFHKSSTPTYTIGVMP